MATGEEGREGKTEQFQSNIIKLKVYNIKDNYPKDNYVYIGRGSVAGNPYKIGRSGTRDECCDKFEKLLEYDLILKQIIIDYCKGKNLVCYCKPLRCHGDYILKIANEE